MVHPTFTTLFLFAGLIGAFVIIGSASLLHGGQQTFEDEARKFSEEAISFLNSDRVKLTLKTACLLAPILIPPGILIACLGAYLSISLCIICAVVLLFVALMVALGLFLLYSGPLAGNPETGSATELISEMANQMAAFVSESGLGGALDSYAEQLAQLVNQFRAN